MWDSKFSFRNEVFHFHKRKKCEEKNCFFLILFCFYFDFIVFLMYCNLKLILLLGFSLRVNGNLIYVQILSITSFIFFFYFHLIFFNSLKLHSFNLFKHNKAIQFENIVYDMLWQNEKIALDFTMKMIVKQTKIKQNGIRSSH